MVCLRIQVMGKRFLLSSRSGVWGRAHEGQGGAPGMCGLESGQRALRMRSGLRGERIDGCSVFSLVCAGFQENNICIVLSVNILAPLTNSGSVFHRCASSFVRVVSKKCYFEQGRSQRVVSIAGYQSYMSTLVYWKLM